MTALQCIYVCTRGSGFLSTWPYLREEGSLWRNLSLPPISPLHLSAREMAESRDNSLGLSRFK